MKITEKFKHINFYILIPIVELPLTILAIVPEFQRIPNKYISLLFFEFIILLIFGITQYILISKKDVFERT
jgi:hypothetical protein